MPNKLTDTEIKKALECCGKNILCIHCPLHEMQQKEGLVCEDRLKLYALDLIKCQEAEIRHLDQESDILRADVENLNRIYDEVNAENESLKAEVERLKANEEMAEGYADALVEYTKAEAYKECLDELARRLGYAFLSKHSCVLDIMENLLNELVGGSQ